MDFKRKAFKGVLLLYSSRGNILAQVLGIGDLHGCWEYALLLQAFIENVDAVVCTGDIGGYSGGKDSAKCYEFMMGVQSKLGDKCGISAGNHEEAFIKCLIYAGVPLTGTSDTAQAGLHSFAAYLLGDDIRGPKGLAGQPGLGGQQGGGGYPLRH